MNLYFIFKQIIQTDNLINKIDGLVVFCLQWRGTNSKFQTSHFCWINYHIGNREGFIWVRQRGIIQIYNSRPSMIFRTPPFHDQISGPWCQLQRNGGNGFHPAPWGITIGYPIMDNHCIWSSSEVDIHCIWSSSRVDIQPDIILQESSASGQPEPCNNCTSWFVENN